MTNIPEKINSNEKTEIKSQTALKKMTEKKPVIKIKKEQAEKKEAVKKTRYIETVGRRKTSVARVRLIGNEKTGGIIEINKKPCDKYFFTPELAKIATASLRKLKILNRFYITAKISGGGIHSQAEALRHGIARALIEYNPEFRKKLKRSGYLKRDSRAKERRKFGLKKARKAPQWSKR